MVTGVSVDGGVTEFLLPVQIPIFATSMIMVRDFATKCDKIFSINNLSFKICSVLEAVVLAFLLYSSCWERKVFYFFKYMIEIFFDGTGIIVDRLGISV